MVLVVSDILHYTGMDSDGEHASWYGSNLVSK